MRNSLEGIEELENIEQIDENQNIINLWEPFEFKIDKNYEYIPKSKIFSIVSNIIYYGVAYPILKILMKLVYDLKIEGKENIENIKGGAISVSNHVLFLDCAMIGLAYGKRRIYYTTQEGSFKITNVPIILIVCTFREPKGIRKILKKKKDVTLKILEPINPQTEKKNRKEESENLKEKVFLEMKRRS